MVARLVLSSRTSTRITTRATLNGVVGGPGTRIDTAVERQRAACRELAGAIRGHDQSTLKRVEIDTIEEWVWMLSCIELGLELALRENRPEALRRFWIIPASLISNDLGLAEAAVVLLRQLKGDEKVSACLRELKHSTAENRALVFNWNPPIRQVTNLSAQPERQGSPRRVSSVASANF